MIDSQLISFLHGLGIKFPENTPHPRGYFLQLLKDQEVKDELYLPWAVEKYQIPLLKNEFFATFKPTPQIWEQFKDHFEWDEGFLPLFQWDEKLVIGCVDLPEKYIERPEHTLILCSVLELEKIWNYYQSPQSFHFVEQLGIQPLDPQTPSSEPVIELDALTIGPSAEMNVSVAPTAEVVKSTVEEDPAALLQLSDEESSTEEEKTDEDSEEGSSEENEESPDGLSLDSSEGSESLSFDLSVPPPKLSLTSLTPTTDSETSAPVTENVVPTMSPQSSAITTEAVATATLLKPNVTEPLAQVKPVVPPPPPPPDTESLISEIPTVPPPKSSNDGAKVIPMKSERFANYDLMKDLSFSEIQNTVEQIFIDYQSQNKLGFFGFVDQEKRKVDMAFRSRSKLEPIERTALTVDQPGILNIVLRTQKPFYGKPYSSEHNLKLYDTVNDSIDPDMIMIVPFILEEKILAVVGFISDEKSYSLDRLFEYESRIQREFRIKLGLSITNLEKAA